MSTATGFVGERLVQARNARAISAVDLSAMTGVSATSISKYENGKQTPRHEVVQKLSSVTGFSRDFFFRRVVKFEDNPVFWRAKLSAQPAILDRAKVRLEWMKEIVDYLCEYIDLPELDLPDLSTPSNPLDISMEDVEQAAQILRLHWSTGSGPLTGALTRVEDSGILVSRIHVNAEKVDAFSQWWGYLNTPMVVLSRDKASAVRQRFDLMHEMAHLLLHRNVNAAQLKNKHTYKIMEGQADYFASVMLLPEKDFLDELYAPTLDSMLSLKERWGVSVAAMIMRCKNLEIFDDDSVRRMWINYSKRGWRKGEPFDSGSTPEKPMLIRKSLEMILSEGVQTVDDIIKALPIPLTELEEISELEPGTLGAPVKIVEPTLKKRIDSKVVSIFRE